MSRIYQKECESSCEYSLPDYMGDVKKVLTVNARAIPSGKFATDGEVEFSGVVSYDVLYADAEGRLTSFSTSSDYDLSCSVGEEYADSLSEVAVTNLSVRAGGPRKISLKSFLSGNIRVIERDEQKLLGTAFNIDAAPELLTKNISVENMIFGTSPEREYAEEAEHLGGVNADDIQILATSGAVRIIESTAVDGGVNVKGELIITAIIRTEEQPAFAIKKSIPFEETVSIEGVTQDMQSVADGYLTSVTAGVSQGVDESIVTVNAISELFSVAYYNSQTALTQDAYLRERDTQARYEDYSYAELVCAASCEAGFEASVGRADAGLLGARNILTLGADIRSVEKKILKNSFEITAEAVVSGVACEINEQDEVSYVPLKITLPFSTNVNCNCQIPPNAAIECRVSAVDLEHSMDSEKLNLTSRVKIGYRISDMHTERRIAECNVVGDNEYPERKSTITVYYPEPGETLFDVAKKFHTTGAKLAHDNKLCEAAFASTDAFGNGIKKLIIR